MINLRSSIYSAFSTASALSAFTVRYQYPNDFTALPVISYFQVTNVGNLFGDDEEYGSNVMFQVDLWSKTPVTDSEDDVNDVMTGLGFVRVYCTDLYENDTKIYHIAMRYRIDYVLT